MNERKIIITFKYVDVVEHEIIFENTNGYDVNFEDMNQFYDIMNEVIGKIDSQMYDNHNKIKDLEKEITQ